MDTAKKLQYHYYDYDFVVADFNLLDPDDSPCIALRRIEGDMIVAYTNYGRFVGAEPGDADHIDRLEAVASMLSHFLMNMDRYGIVRLSDIRPEEIDEYIFVMCTGSEAVYVSEFVCNLADAGYLTYVSSLDIAAFNKELM